MKIFTLLAIVFFIACNAVETKAKTARLDTRVEEYASIVKIDLSFELLDKNLSKIDKNAKITLKQGKVENARNKTSFKINNDSVIYFNSGNDDGVNTNILLQIENGAETLELPIVLETKRPNIAMEYGGDAESECENKFGCAKQEYIPNPPLAFNGGLRPGGNVEGNWTFSFVDEIEPYGGDSPCSDEVEGGKESDEYKKCIEEAPTEHIFPASITIYAPTTNQTYEIREENITYSQGNSTAGVFTVNENAVQELLAKLPNEDLIFGLSMKVTGHFFTIDPYKTTYIGKSLTYNFYSYKARAKYTGTLVNMNKEVVKSLSGYKMAVKGYDNDTRVVTTIANDGTFTVDNLSSGTYRAVLLDLDNMNSVSTQFAVYPNTTYIDQEVLVPTQMINEVNNTKAQNKMQSNRAIQSETFIANTKQDGFIKRDRSKGVETKQNNKAQNTRQRSLLQRNITNNVSSYLASVISADQDNTKSENISYTIPKGVKKVRVEVQVSTAEFPQYTQSRSIYNDIWSYNINIAGENINASGKVNDTHFAMGTITDIRYIYLDKDNTNTQVNGNISSTNIGDFAYPTTVAVSIRDVTNGDTENSVPSGSGNETSGGGTNNTGTGNTSTGSGTGNTGTGTNAGGGDTGTGNTGSGVDEGTNIGGGDGTNDIESGGGNTDGGDNTTDIGNTGNVDTTANNWRNEPLTIFNAQIVPNNSNTIISPIEKANPKITDPFNTNNTSKVKFTGSLPGNYISISGTPAQAIQKIEDAMGKNNKPIKITFDYSPKEANISSIRLGFIGIYENGILGDDLIKNLKIVEKGKAELNITMPKLSANTTIVSFGIKIESNDTKIKTNILENSLISYGGSKSFFPLYFIDFGARFSNDQELKKGGDSWGRASTAGFLAVHSYLRFNDISALHVAQKPNGESILGHAGHSDGLQIDLRYANGDGTFNNELGGVEKGRYIKNLIDKAKIEVFNCEEYFKKNKGEFDLQNCYKSQTSSPNLVKLVSWIKDNRTTIEYFAPLAWRIYAGDDWLWRVLVDGKFLDNTAIPNVGKWGNIPSIVNQEAGHLDHWHISLKPY